MFDDIITINVGKEHAAFQIHKGLLAYHSISFAQTLNQPMPAWAPAQWKPDPVNIEDVSPENFKIFIGWAYTGLLADSPQEEYLLSISILFGLCSFAKRYHILNLDMHTSGILVESLTNLLEEGRSCPLPTLVQACVFAEKRGEAQLHNRAVDALCQAAKRGLYTFSSVGNEQDPNEHGDLASSASYVYEHCGNVSPLRKMVVDLAVCMLNEMDDSATSALSNCPDITREILIDIFAALQFWGSSMDWSDIGSLAYHMWTSGDEHSSTTDLTPKTSEFEEDDYDVQD